MGPISLKGGLSKSQGNLVALLLEKSLICLIYGIEFIIAIVPKALGNRQKHVFQRLFAQAANGLGNWGIVVKFIVR